MSDEQTPPGAPADDAAPPADAATTDDAAPADEAATADEAAPADDGASAQQAERKSESSNRLRWLRGGVIAVLGALVPFFFMITDRRWGVSVPVGFFGCLISVLGILDLLGSFDDRASSDDGKLDRSRLLSRLAELAASGAALFLALRLAVAGTLPLPIASAALLVTASFLWTVVSVYRTGRELGGFGPDDDGVDRPLLRRHGFWVVTITTLIYLPLLGSFSLSDPWETHYGEVAREMIARDDWISTWWAQESWFWSKPVLDFWMQALSFKALGVRAMPDQMLASAAQGHFPQPEWAARLPVFLLNLSANYLLYKGVARVFGRRAGMLGAIVLVTMPYWFLIAHQTMTDMPYVAPLTAAMGLFLLAFHTDPAREVRRYELTLGPVTLRIGLHHLVLGAIALLALPQVLYLASRNLTLQLDAAPHGFRPHLDEFWSGSGGGNCGLPGNEACRRFVPVNAQLQPWMAALLWGFVGGLVLWINRGERRLSRLYFLAGWTFVAISALAKGAPGLVLPLFVLGAYVGATRRWTDLGRAELVSMVLIVLCVTLPWYVQMYMRHGQPFTDRLLFHDMYKRAFVHVHDTNAGDDVSFRYYIWQLAYGLFPWTGLAAGGLVWWARRKNDVSDPRGDGGTLLALWFVSAFSMFTITLTKFHHYVLPVVPPTAMLIGVLLDHALGERELPKGRRLALYLSGMGLGSLLLVYGELRRHAGSITGRTLDGKTPPEAVPWLGYLCLALGLFVIVGCVKAFRRAESKTDRQEPQPAEPPEPATSGASGALPPEPALAMSSGQTLPLASAPAARVQESYDAVILGALGLCAAVVVALAGRDMFVTNPGDIDGQARLMHLFTYNYRRPWPESLQFQGALLAFTVIAALACALFMLRAFRAHATVVLLSVSILWGAWGTNVYLFKAAPHWGQRETVLAYYTDREGPHQPLVAFQMNWKGENFYTSNKLPAFVSTGQKFKDWIEQQKKNGVTTIYFTTEHGRESGLKNEVGPHKEFAKITDEVLNNKFFVARVRF